jgi:hypothetical protein
MKTTMKKNQFSVLPALFGALFAVMMLNGCASMLESLTKVWDETLPESETAFVSFCTSKATAYNGVDFEKAYPFARIPSGEADFTINMAFNWYNAVYKAEGMEFEYTFEGGKKYTVHATYRSTDKDDNVVGVKIYDYFAMTADPSEKYFVTFIPFKQQPTFRRTLF